MSKEEKKHRQEAEDKLKGNDDRVYKPPEGMNSLVARIYVVIVEELNKYCTEDIFTYFCRYEKL